MRFHGFLSPTLLLARTNHTSATTTHKKIYLAHSSWHSYWMCVLLLFYFEFQSKYQNCIIQKVWKYESSLRPEQTRFRLIWCCRYRFNRINFTHKKKPKFLIVFLHEPWKFPWCHIFTLFHFHVVAIFSSLLQWKRNTFALHKPKKKNTKRNCIIHDFQNVCLWIWLCFFFPFI